MPIELHPDNKKNFQIDTIDLARERVEAGVHRVLVIVVPDEGGFEWYLDGGSKLEAVGILFASASKLLSSETIATEQGAS